MTGELLASLVANLVLGMHQVGVSWVGGQAIGGVQVMGVGSWESWVRVWSKSPSWRVGDGVTEVDGEGGRGG